MREEKLKEIQDMMNGMQVMPQPKVRNAAVAEHATFSKPTIGTIKSLDDVQPESMMAVARGRNRHQAASQDTSSVRSIKSILKKKSASPVS